jgi:hypothetical protein
MRRDLRLPLGVFLFLGLDGHDDFVPEADTILDPYIMEVHQNLHISTHGAVLGLSSVSQLEWTIWDVQTRP